MKLSLRSTSLITLVLLSSAVGCKSMPWGESGMKLPSPWSTVSKSSKSNETPSGEKFASHSSSKKTSKSKGKTDDSPLALEIARGRSMERNGDYAKARAHYEQLWQDNAQNAQLAHRLGVVADQQKRHIEAEQYFLISLRHDPNDANVRGDLGYCYFLQGKLPQAESHLLQAVQLEPANPRFHNNLGLVFGHMGKHEFAFDEFSKGGSEADAYYNLAFVLASQDKTEDAMACFKEALVSDPKHKGAREALDSFKRYETLPDHLRNADSEYADNVRMVPYMEGDENEGAQQASAEFGIPSSRDAGRHTRSLQDRSRAMLRSNMQSTREAEFGS